MADTTPRPESAALTHESTVVVENGTAVITMRRGARHMLDADMTAWLAATFRDLDGRDDVAAVVITGAEGTFCGGADGPHLRASGTAAPFADAMTDLFTLMPKLRVPVVAAVEGDALAGGFGIVCLADIIVAGTGARFGTIEASLGTWAMLAQVPASRRVPQKALVTNLLTGEPWGADEAHRLGVVDVVVDDDAVLSTAHDFAERTKSGGAAMRIGLPAYYAATEQPYDEALAAGVDAFIKQFS